MLKGLDMMVLEAFRRLKVDANIKPVLESKNYEGDFEMIIGREPSRRRENLYSCEQEGGVGWMVDEWRGGEELDYKKVHWIGEPLHKQVQMSYIAVSW